MSQKIKIIFHFLFYLLLVSPSFGQTASILPQGYTQYFDANGNPVSAGKVYNYIVGTTTFKNTWQDSAEAILNTNPVTLDAAGKAKILGQGAYRQIVKASNGNLIWDAVTSSTGSGSSSTSTGDGDLVGTIKPWAGIIAPNQYAFTYGQEVNRATFSVLMTAITQTINNIVCTSGNPILNGFSDTTSINYGSAVEISCMAPGTTVVSKTSSTVTVSNNATISNTVTGVFYPFGNGDGSTTFNLPDLRGRAVAGRDNMGGVVAGRLTTAFFGANSPDAQGGTGGSQSHLIIQAEEPQHRHTITVTDPGHTHTVTASLLGGSTFTAGGVSGQATSPTPITSSSNTTSITSNSSYSGSTPTTVTITAANPAVVSWSAHGFLAGQQVTFQTTGALPTPLVAGTTYFVIAAGLAAGSFEVSATLGGSTISTNGGGGSGTHNGQALNANTAFSIIQPTMTMNYIIKTTPDTNSALATGVTDIAGMTGSIACGASLLCTGNIIDLAAGVGNVTGPNSAVNENVALFNGTSGHIIKDGGGGAPNIPVLNPSSGNLVGPGCTTIHSLGWLDQNWCINSDSIRWRSIDPSGNGILTFGGTLVAGHIYTINFRINSITTYTITYTIQPGDTYALVASGVAAAITANPNLWTSPNGGYGSGAVISYLANSGVAGLAFDYDTRKIVEVSYTVSGGGSETVAVSGGWFFNGTTNTLLTNGSTVSTFYKLPNAWDNNPVLNAQRFVSGQSPARGSILYEVAVVSNNSASLSAVNLTYGNFSHWVCNSLSGFESSRWLAQTIDGGGTWFGAGIYSNYGGGLPCDPAGATVDKGSGTINAGLAYYLANKTLSPVYYSHGDSAFVIPNDAAYVTTSAVFTAPRAWTLPLAANVVPGKLVCIQDYSGGITSTNTLTLSNGSDTIDGAASLILTSGAAGICLAGDGVSKWSYIVQPVTAGGTGRTSFTANAALVGNGTGNVVTTSACNDGTIFSGRTSGGPDCVTASGDLTQLFGVFTLGTINHNLLFSASAPGANFGVTTNNTSSTGNSTYLMTNDGTTTAGFFLTGTGNAIYAGAGSFNMVHIGNAPIGFGTNNTIRMTLSASGGLSIGTATDPGIGAILANTSIKATTSVTAVTAYNINTKLAWSATAPSVASGFCSSPSISNNNGTAAFTVTIGSACAASTGVLTMPSAAVGWACNFRNVTNNATNAPSQTASTVTTVSVTNYVRTTGVAGNWTASDVIVADCTAY